MSILDAILRRRTPPRNIAAEAQKAQEIPAAEQSAEILNQLKGRKYIDVKTLPSRQTAKLMDVVQKNYEDMSKYRSAARLIKSEYMGHLLRGDTDANKTVVINRLKQAIMVYQRLMMSGDPQVFLSSENRKIMPYAYKFQLALNKNLVSCRIKDTLMRAKLAAMWGIGIVKTGNADSGSGININGQFYDMGEPFSMAVNLNNFVVDMQAGDYEQIDLIGDRFQRPQAWIEEQYRLNERGVPMDERVQPYAREGGAFRDLGVEDRLQSRMQPEQRVSGVQEDDQARLYKEKWLWDIWLPKEKMIVTIPDGASVPLAVSEYDGPKGGPYDILGFMWSDEEIMPIPPTHDLYELHMILNALMRKVNRGVNQYKKYSVFNKGNDQDAQTERDVSHGGMIGVMDINAVAEKTSGGVEPALQAILMYLQKEFNALGGGLDLLQGTAPMSPTWGQDKMLMENANILIKTMQDAVIDFTLMVIMKQAWWMWTDPLKVLPITIEKYGLTVNDTFTPEERAGKFEDYNFKLDLYSLKNETPMEKYQKLMSVLQTWVMPTADLAMRNSMALNYPEICRELFKLSGINIESIYTFANPQEAPSGGGGETPPPRHRLFETVNTRISKPGMNPQGTDVNIMQSLMGANPQNEQAALVGGGE